MDIGGIARVILVDLEVAVLVYFVAISTFYAVLLASAAAEMRAHVLRIRGESRWRVLSSAVAPSISMLAPAFNEASTISDSVRALLTLSYPNLEIVIINDGSRDGTLDVLRRELSLVPLHPIFRRTIRTRPVRGLYRSGEHPTLLVIDKENGGKADSLNAGLNVASADLVCAIDADTLIEPDALQRMVRPFLEGDQVLAAGGTIRVANSSIVRQGRVAQAHVPGSPLPGFQVIEYLRAFLFGRLGWNRLGGNLIISGAFGLFRRQSMLAIGGYTSDTVGEDMEVVVRLRRGARENGQPDAVRFIPDPVAWTEVPSSLRVLGRQRDRWHRGLADVLWRHRAVLFNPRYGAFGLVVYPYFVLVELLAPVIEAIGLIGLVVGLVVGAVDVPFAILFFCVAYGYGLNLSLATLLLEELSFRRYAGLRDHALLLLWAVLENFGYRQLTVLWRLRGLVNYLRRRTTWGAMERRGFAGAPKT